VRIARLLLATKITESRLGSGASFRRNPNRFLFCGQLFPELEKVENPVSDARNQSVLPALIALIVKCSIKEEEPAKICPTTFSFHAE
jgi:hypothetical protein